MSTEVEYIRQILQHSDEHSKGQPSKTEDLSCIICYTENQREIENQAFAEFWEHVIKPRSVKVIFTTNTIQVFEELRRCNRSFTANQLIRQLVQTIRYWEIPSFQILEEAIEFYWGATKKFSNWEIFCSENSSETSSVQMNNDETKSVIIASVSNNERSEQIFDKENDFNSRKNEGWQVGLRSVRFSSVFTKTVTEPKLSVSVLTEKNRFSFDQNRYWSVITENRTDLLTHSSGIHHAEG
jgi:hypothetical protein